MDDYKLELVSSNIAPWQPVNGISRQIVVMMSGGVDSSVTAHLKGEMDLNETVKRIKTNTRRFA